MMIRNAGLQTGVRQSRDGGAANADLKIGVPKSVFCAWIDKFDALSGLAPR
jgi:hypothetical protein